MRPKSEAETNQHERNGRIFLPKDPQKGWQADELTPQLLVGVFGPGWKVLIEDELRKRRLMPQQAEVPWEEPLATHDGSGLFYAIDAWEIGGHLVYAQVAAEGDESTIHGHTYPELYVAKKGGISVIEEEDSIWLPEGTSHLVPAGIRHQVKGAKDSWSLTFLLGITGGVVPKEHRHLDRINGARQTSPPLTV